MNRTGIEWTGIEWTDVTWNPIRGCSRVSEGCRNCYAEKVAARFSGPGQAYEGLAEFRIIGQGTPAERREAHWTGKLKFLEEDLGLDGVLSAPMRMRKPRKIFVNSMSDLFHPEVKDWWIDMILAVIADCPQHTFQVLTKRPERMLEYFSKFTSASAAADRLSWVLDDSGQCDFNEEFACRVANRINGVCGEEHNVGWPLKNLWLGVSVEDQKTANERIPLLLQTPAVVRWISAEPLLGPLGLTRLPWRDGAFIDALTGWEHFGVGYAEGGPRLDWIVAGGESGPHARPMDPEWVRGLRDHAMLADVPFFFKQWGEFVPAVAKGAVSGEVGMRRVGKKSAGAVLDGREWRQMPRTAVSA